MRNGPFKPLGGEPMTDDAHVPTEQETQIYDHMNAGEWDQIDQLRQDAYTADQTPPEDAPDDWLAPAQQYDEDYQNAWRHYQADHEAPEKAREVATKTDVQDENATAAAAEEGINAG